MTEYVILGIVILPALLFIALRSNAALAFLSLCLGSVLAQVAAGDASAVIGAVKSGQTVSTNTAALILLLAPPLVMAILTIRSVRPRHLLLQLIPAAGVGATGLLLAQPYLKAAWQTQLAHSGIWTQINNLQVVIVGASAFLCLLIVWLQRPHIDKSRRGEH